MRIVPVKEKVAIHTAIDKPVRTKIEGLAKRFDITKSDVINSILVLGLAANARHARKRRRTGR